MIDAAPPERPSPNALEGSCAHWVHERALTEDTDARAMLGETKFGHEVTEDMADAVQVSLDYVRSRLEYGNIDDGDVVMVERKFDLAPLDPPAPIFGTADVCIYKPKTQRLLVIDYKHGRGVTVEAGGNGQMRIYALGAVVALGTEYPVREVEATIVQPRGRHPDGPIRSETVEPFELVEWSAEMFRAMEATLAPDAPLSAGEHCRWCPAAGTCPALASKALAVAEADFTVLDQPKAPPAPDTLTPTQVSHVLSHADVLEKWLASVRGHAQGMLERGETLPGWTLVEKRGRRAFTDEAAARKALLAAKVPEDDFAPRKLVSPAQAEKLLGKPGYREHLADLVETKSSGVTLAPETDKRPAVTGGAEGDFAAITD
jgi:hypothetical protein